METIAKHIETSEFQNIYLLYGEEGYLKNQYRDKLRDAMIDKDDSMNYGYYEGDKIPVIEVLDLGDTMPFFSERRVFVIENSGWFKKSPEDIEKRLEAFPDSTHLIFVENEIDKRSRLYKYAAKNGYVTEMKTPTGSMLVKWVGKQCKAENKKIETETCKFLVAHMGSDMMQLQNELNKLFAYCHDKEVIALEDVQEVCISQAVEKVFKMIDAMADKNQKQALALYHDLLALREPPMRVLFNITNHFKSMLELSIIPEDKGYHSKELASLCGIMEFSVKKNRAQANNFTKEELERMVNMCLDTNQYIRQGRVSDIVGVELLIVEFSK